MSVTSHASNFGIRSSESLGGGLTGWVQYEFNVKMERDFDLAGANGSTRNTAIGLRGNFGNVYLGTWETPWASTFRLWDVGTIGGWGPTTSIIGRRETTASAPSSNCQGIFQGGTNLTTSALGSTSLCYHAEGQFARAAGLPAVAPLRLGRVLRFAGVQRLPVQDRLPAERDEVDGNRLDRKQRHGVPRHDQQDAGGREPELLVGVADLDRHGRQGARVPRQHAGEGLDDHRPD